MKKKSLLLTFGLLFAFSATQFSYCTLDNFDDDDDIFAIDTDFNTISLENAANFTIPATRTLGSADTLYALFTLLQSMDPQAPATLLNLPIYQRTSPVRNRPILEYPYALTYGFDTKDQNSLSLFLFLNYWNPKNYTQTGTTLNTYFDLGNAQKIAVLEAFNEEYAGQGTTALGVVKSVNLFDPATIEERRIGGLLEAHVAHNKWNLMMQLPIVYSEQNLHLKPWEKAAIGVSALGKMLQTDGVSQDDFIYDHIVMDQFGIGDFKFKAMYQMHRTQTFNLDLGGFVIFPTAAALKQGIVGVWFDQNNNRPYFDLTTLDTENPSTQSQDQIANYFIAAIDKLSSNILNTPLGNGGFVVLAPSMNFDWYFAYNWQFSNDFSLQVPLPTIQPRFYQYSQTNEQFQAAYDAAYAQGAETFATFVNQEIQNLLFPYEFPTRVFPGIVVNSTNQFLYTFRDWDFSFGNNFWYVGKESLTPPTFGYSANYAYDYAGATAASAMQDKLFAKINCNLETTNYAWCLGLYADFTVWNKGIGQDYTFAVSVDCKF